MQSVRSRIWTRVAVSITSEANHYTTGNPSIGALSSATTPGQSGPGSDSTEGVHRIPQSSRITGTSPSDCLVSYTGLSFGGWSYPSAEVQSVYSTAPVDWEIYIYIYIYIYILLKNFNPLPSVMRCITVLKNNFIIKQMFYRWNEKIIQDFSID